MAQPEGAKPTKAKRQRLVFLRNAKALTGITVLGIYVLFAIIGPWVAPFDPDARSNDLLQGPSAKHWFGTTHLGQDIFSQLLSGTRSVVYVGFLAGIIATTLSVLIGVTAGYLGGKADDTLSVLTNVVLVIPAIPLMIIITSALSSANDTLIAVIIGLTSWSWNARVLRAQTLSLRRRDFVEASRATGEKTWRIIIFELLPNLTAVIASGFIGTVVFAVLSEITLAFIGIASTSGWNWGTILFWAQIQQALGQGAWWWFVPAGLAIAFLGTALSLINFGIDEFVSPRLRSAGKTKIKTNAGHTVRMRIGFTPVLSNTPEPRTHATIHPDVLTPVAREAK
ncbi:ABC transporter permease [Actinoplanes sp. URMC 104]|uniref:ABC transporter permease n=1 Tax=Actinoplanes sp. URMC 104 TaxID=3423409 RepID=UPI003F1BE64B